MNLPHVINFDQPEDSNQETPQSNSRLKGAYLMGIWECYFCKNYWLTSQKTNFEVLSHPKFLVYFLMRTSYYNVEAKGTIDLIQLIVFKVPKEIRLY